MGLVRLAGLVRLSRLAGSMGLVKSMGLVRLAGPMKLAGLAGSMGLVRSVGWR
jgi:hypothetical protein